MFFVIICSFNLLFRMYSFKSTIGALLILASVAAGIRQVDHCQNIPDGVFLSDINDCSKYVDCYNQTARFGECREPYLFDAQSQMCNYASKVECTQTRNTSVLSTHAFDNICQRYVLWFADQALVRECGKGLLYNANTDRCDLAQRVDCTAKLCNGVDSVKYLPSKEKCDQYFMCYGKQLKVQTCNKGSHFSAESSSCELTDENNKCNIKLSAIPFARMPPQRAAVVCPKTGMHFFPDKKNTNRYYYCVNGKSAVLTCTPGLVYDPKEEECRRPTAPNKS